LSLYGLLSTVVVAVLLYLAVRVILRAIKWLLRRNTQIDATQRLLAEKLIAIALFVFALLFGIDLLGIDLTALAVFSGAAGLAIGFGLQKTVGNLIAGIILLMDRSIKPGDIIVVGDGSNMGGRRDPAGCPMSGALPRSGCARSMSSPATARST
jgi:small-conductance mechanosensitive channel